MRAYMSTDAPQSYREYVCGGVKPLSLCHESLQEARRILAETEPGDGWGEPYYIGHINLSSLHYADGNNDGYVALAESLARFIALDLEA